MAADRQLYGCAQTAADGLPRGLEIRPRRGLPPGSVHGENLRRRAFVLGRRPLHADPRRHGALEGAADRALLPRPAQHDDHRRLDRSAAHGARADDSGYSIERGGGEPDSCAKVDCEHASRLIGFDSIAGLPPARMSPQEHVMERDFEDHCWKDIVDADTLQIYQAYRRKIYVGD